MLLTAVPDPADVAQHMASLGAAGLMGWMWLWERRAGRDRERQLTEAHARILAKGDQLDAVLVALRSNTEALTRLNGLFEQLHRDCRQVRRRGEREAE